LLVSVGWTRWRFSMLVVYIGAIPCFLRELTKGLVVGG
jgi:hypothetical protein